MDRPQKIRKQDCDTLLHRSDESALAEGFDAVWRADFDRAVAMLHNVEAPGCAALRGRVYVRIGHPERAIAEFERATFDGLHPRERAELTLIAWVAFRAVGNQVRAEELARKAEALCEQMAEPLFTLMYLHLSSVHDFVSGNLERSRKIAAQALNLADRCRNTEAPLPYLFEGNHMRSRLLDTMSMHAAIAGDHHEQERLLVDAVLTSTLVRYRDIFTEVNFLANLATLLTTYPGLRSRELVLSRSKTIAWNDHLDNRRTYIKRGLRSNKDIFGSSQDVESFGGRGYPTLAGRVGDIADRLLNANWADAAAFDSEMAFAIELADRIEWQSTPGEEIVGLTLLCALVAPRHSDVADRLMIAYRRKLETLSGHFLYMWDGRRPALEKFAEATIAKSRGDFASALDKYAESQRFWADRGILAREAIIGIERFTMSRDAADREPAIRFLRTFPNSGFARRLGGAFEKSEHAKPGDFPFLDQGSAA